MNNFSATIMIINVIIMMLWVWMAVIKVQEKRSWHSYGCLVLAASYGLLVWVDHDIYKLGNIPVVNENSTMVYFATIMQLGAAISFLIFTYTKDHARNPIK